MSISFQGDRHQFQGFLIIVVVNDSPMFLVTSLSPDGVAPVAANADRCLYFTTSNDRGACKVGDIKDAIGYSLTMSKVSPAVRSFVSVPVTSVVRLMLCHRRARLLLLRVTRFVS